MQTYMVILLMQQIYMNNNSKISEFQLLQDFSENEEIRELIFDSSKYANNTGHRRSKKVASDSVCPIDGISKEECYELASITPLLGVNKKCEEQSLTYLTELFGDRKSDDGWARRSMNKQFAPLVEKFMMFTSSV